MPDMATIVGGVVLAVMGGVVAAGKIRRWGDRLREKKQTRRAVVEAEMEKNKTLRDILIAQVERDESTLFDDSPFGKISTLGGGARRDTKEQIRKNEIKLKQMSRRAAKLGREKHRLDRWLNQ
jgi:hypothetical protein